MGRRWWIGSGLVVLMASLPALAQGQGQERFRLLVTNETGSMEEELNRVGAAGYRFAATPGSETSFVGNGVVTMELDPEGRRFRYILLATMRASTLQRELNEVPPEFDIVGMMAFGSLKEAVVILEAEIREGSAP
ncbi:MAG: hypothetical protein OXG35_28420 [Acidobacteria bacterium]|nr:hypothetical protein [Acidobacteriota bacterium]